MLLLLLSELKYTRRGFALSQASKVFIFPLSLIKAITLPMFPYPRLVEALFPYPNGGGLLVYLA